MESNGLVCRILLNRIKTVMPTVRIHKQQIGEHFQVSYDSYYYAQSGLVISCSSINWSDTFNAKPFERRSRSRSESIVNFSCRDFFLIYSQNYIIKKNYIHQALIYNAQSTLLEIKLNKLLQSVKYTCKRVKLNGGF